MKHTQNIDTKRAVIRNSVIRGPSGDRAMKQPQALAGSTKAFGLTPKTAEMLRFIDSYTTSSGVCPTFAEIMQHGGYASKSNVHRIILSLERRGYINRLPRSARSLKVSETGVDWLRQHRTRAAESPR